MKMKTKITTIAVSVTAVPYENKIKTATVIWCSNI